MTAFKSWSDFLYSTSDEERRDITIYVDEAEITIELPDGEYCEVDGEEGRCSKEALAAVLREFGFNTEVE